LYFASIHTIAASAASWRPITRQGLNPGAGNISVDPLLPSSSAAGRDICKGERGSAYHRQNAPDELQQVEILALFALEQARLSCSVRRRSA
jgi:hypothetical protein